jgi:hypothetical protein
VQAGAEGQHEQTVRDERENQAAAQALRFRGT